MMHPGANPLTQEDYKTIKASTLIEILQRVHPDCEIWASRTTGNLMVGRDLVLVGWVDLASDEFCRFED